MFKFSAKSLAKLATCHSDIQMILTELITMYDFSVLEGHRTQETQMRYFAEGKSKLDGVNKLSKHQSYPSMAVDIMPYAEGFNAFTDKNGEKAFYYMAGLVMAIADRLLREGKITHKVTWGGNWDGDSDFFNDSTFFDLPHFQLDKIK